MHRSRPVSVVTEQVPPAPEEADDADEHVRDVVPADGAPDRQRRTVDVEPDLDEIAEHDTVVLGRPGDDAEDPRARIPAWEDIVFGVRKHR
jgi:hypothetical protein